MLLYFGMKNLWHFTDWASAATALFTHFYLGGNDNSLYFQVLLLEKQYLQIQH